VRVFEIIVSQLANRSTLDLNNHPLKMAFFSSRRFGALSTLSFLLLLLCVVSICRVQSASIPKPSEFRTYADYLEARFGLKCQEKGTNSNHRNQHHHTDESIRELCGECARQTGDRRAYGLCCANEEGAWDYCRDFVNYTFDRRWSQIGSIKILRQENQMEWMGNT